MSKVRFMAALWAAKLSKPVLKLCGRNATNFPGEVALKLCPDYLRYIGKPKKIVAVTGTNGKTTCCNLITSALEADGMKILSNRAGSNISTGIAAALTEGCSLSGKTKYETAVLEVDERSALRIFKYVKPEYLVITNLTRDSVMRNAHPAYIADILTKAIPSDTKLILNGNDLIAVGVAPENERVYFGLDDPGTGETELKNRIDDLRVCPKCAGKLEYSYRIYHHIGKCRCRDCGYESPVINYLGTDVDIGAKTVAVSENGEKQVCRLLSDSRFNVFNLTAVVAVLRELGISREKAALLIDKIELPKSRFNEKTGNGITAVMQMAKDKNAFAISRVFDDIASREGEKEIIMMNCCLEDHIHSSENVCWMYDCDFEFLNTDSIKRIVVTGPRYLDFKLRLLTAGVPEEKIRTERTETESPKELLLCEGEKVYILYGTAGIELASKVQSAAIKEAGERRKAK